MGLDGVRFCKGNNEIIGSIWIEANAYGRELVIQARTFYQPSGIVVLFNGRNKIDESKRLYEQALSSGAILQVVVLPFRRAQECQFMKDVFLAARPGERWQVCKFVAETKQHTTLEEPWQLWNSSLLHKSNHT